MASKTNQTVTFEVTSSDATKIERIRKWDKRHLRYGGINHFGEVAFEEWLKSEYAAYEAAMEQEKRRKEEEKRRKQQEAAMLSQSNSVIDDMTE